MLIVLLLMLLQVMCFCQERPKGGQVPPEKGQTLTPAQTATLKTILSKYDASQLTAADARAIHEKLRDAGLHAGPETKEAIVAAGFDPEKLRALDPPKNSDDKTKAGPPTTEERLKTLQEKVIRPLALNTTQAEVITKAWNEFFLTVERLKKSQAGQSGPLERSKIEPLEKTRDEKISRVLSAVQYSKYQELEKATKPSKPGSAGSKQN